MKITQRLVVLFLIVALSLSVFIYIFLYIKKEEGKLYSQADALQRRQIITAFIDLKKSEIMRLVDETSAEEAMVSYTGNRSTLWAQRNLSRLLSVHDMDLVQVYDASGKVYYSAASGRQPSLHNLTLPPEFFDNLSSVKQLYFTEPWQKQYVQIGASSIHAPADTSQTATFHGYLVIGRLWSSSYLENISQALDYTIGFYSSEPPPAPAKSIFNVNMTIPLYDWQNEPVAWLQFSSDNPFIGQWQDLSRSMLLRILMFTLVFLVLQFALLLIWIRAPLKQISNSLKFGNPDIILPLSSKNNEFGEVAKLIKRFFEQNQQLRNEMEERRKTETMLRQAQKMESVGTLAGGIAHDFNNIITIISGYVALAAGKTKDQPDVGHNLDEAMIACLRAKRLIEKILTFSRQTEKNVQPVSMAEVVEETMELLSQTIPSSTTIKTDLRSHAYVLADPIEMQQVVMNLATNSYQAMRYQGGALTIYLSELPGIQVHSLVTDADPYLDYVCLAVQDTGTGITRDILERIFDPYFSTKAPGEGTGLGLSIVQSIVTGNGGYIKVSSTVGHGTTVSVYLPTTTLRITEQPAKTPKAVFIPATLYFVDDEVALTNLFTETLTEAGYTVMPFTDGISALERFRENPGECSLLVADIAMPELNGIQLAQKIRRLSPNLPIILYSGFSDTTIQKNCRELGINRLLVKPVLPDTLTHIIREILAEQKPVLNLPL
jgi:signal transduction histidine kinase/CheY-like chemotaxis protein